MTTQLSKLTTGTRFQLYKRNRDGSKRSPFRFNGRDLMAVELVVLGSWSLNPDTIVVALPDGTSIPLDGNIRIRSSNGHR